MAATLVTGYVRLNSRHRSHERYLELGRRLIGVGQPTVVFYDGPPADLAPTPNTLVLPASLDRCWLYAASRGAAAPVPNDAKDSADYAVVQHQKTEWLAEVAAATGDHAVWIDFGIFHLPAGVAESQIRDLFRRVAAAPPDRITIAGIWPMRGRPLIDWTTPAWYVAGGVLVVPPAQADWFHRTTVKYATLQIEASRRCTWEVNTWSAIVRDHPDRFSVYAANHDATLFTGYGGPPP